MLQMATSELTAADQIAELQKKRGALLANHTAAVRLKDPAKIRQANAALAALEADVRLWRSVEQQEEADAADEAKRGARELRKERREAAKAHFARKAKISADMDQLVNRLGAAWLELEAADKEGRTAAEKAMSRTMDSSPPSWAIIEALFHRLAGAGIPMRNHLNDPNSPTIAAVSDAQTLKCVSELNHFTRDLDQ